MAPEPRRPGTVALPRTESNRRPSIDKLSESDILIEPRIKTAPWAKKKRPWFRRTRAAPKKD